MNAPRANAPPRDANGADPLASWRPSNAGVADLVFGSLSKTQPDDTDATRPTNPPPMEMLDLDLTDPAQRQFGDYELLEEIGAGGMGIVYRARQISLDREVAVKLLSAGPWASREFIERFNSEARSAARMQHPNIVAIYEVGSVEGLHFFSMRLVHGLSLAALIQRDGKLPALRAAQLLRTIAEAIDYAHRMGVLHLDLKPANVLVDENGIPLVADFGLARRMGQGLAANPNKILGTPSYMAPEQTVAAAEITPATDIWGLGAIAYELVAGQPPFVADSTQATLNLVSASKVRNPRRYAPQLPRDMQAIVLKCMAHEAAARYPSASALADDLGRFIESRAIAARPLNPAQRLARWVRRERGLAASIACAGVAVAIALTLGARQWQNAAIADKAIAVLPLQNVRLPTKNVEAYDFYLRALALFNPHDSAKNTDPAPMEKAIVEFTKAVTRDPDFALAHAMLAQTQMNLYWQWTGQGRFATELPAAAYAEAERALALQPDFGEAHFALALYRYYGFRDYAAALKELDLARRTLPDRTYLEITAGFIQRRQGQWQRALASFQRAVALDSRSIAAHGNVAQTYFFMRDYARAYQQELRAADLGADPAQLRRMRALIGLSAKADLSPWKAFLDAAVPGTHEYADLAHARYVYAYYIRDIPAAVKAVDSSQQALWDFSEAQVPRDLFLAWAYTDLHDAAHARPLYAKIHKSAQQNVAQNPDDPAAHRIAGFAAAGLGRKDEAIREARRCTQLMPVGRDAFVGAECLNGLNAVYLAVGEYDQALDLLLQRMAMPDIGYLTLTSTSFGALTLSPRWDPVRSDPRFQQALKRAAASIKSIPE